MSVTLEISYRGVVEPVGQGFATVAEVPAVCVGDDEAVVVVEALPVLPVDGVEPVVGEVEEVVLPVLALVEGVQGATVEVVPLLLVLLLPVTLPAAPVELEGLEPGVDVCRVPMEPVDPVELGVVEVVPGAVDVVP